MYDHKEIERKTLERWDKEKIYVTKDIEADKKNVYVLSEFPYPSGDLHVGHWYAFAVTDMYARFKRMIGHNVLFPIGFDSFGLPAENAAIQRGVNPKDWTYKNIDTMTAQLKSMGTMLDWSRKIVTSDKDYYKWTQWIFIQFYKNKLAYRKDGPVNWCTSCNTVIANEQVVDGLCERCDNKVVEKKLRQWFLAITKYADELIDDLDKLPWRDDLKEQQKNWIGRSFGYKLKFQIIKNDNVSNISLDAFTTRIDTLLGVTFIAISPEHRLMDVLLEYADNTPDIQVYINKAKDKSVIERTNVNSEKTGVQLGGVFVEHPVTKEKIPVYAADYVSAGYGTGMVMGVPAHDTRDHQFAEIYGLPIKKVIDTDEDDGVEKGRLINSGEFDGLGFDDACVAISTKIGAEKTHQYRLRDWSVSRQRYWGCPIPIVYDPNGDAHPVPVEYLPWEIPEDVDAKPTGTAPLKTSKEFLERTERLFGKGWTPECETLDTFVDSSWYFLRYLDSKNDNSFCDIEKQKKWMPVSYYFGGAEHTTLHLLYSRFFYKALKSLSHVTKDEPYSHRYNRGLIADDMGKKMSKSKGNTVNPDDEVARVGADAVRAYLAFLGPYNVPANYPWNGNGLIGMRKFLERFWSMQDMLSDEDHADTKHLLHKTIKGVTEDIEALKFNTAISKIMIFTNHILKVKQINKNTYKQVILLLSPISPILTEELWSRIKEDDSVHLASWPEYDKNIAMSAQAKIAVQILGKTKSVIEVPMHSSEEEVVNAAKTQVSQVGDYIEKNGENRIIFVKNKIVNFV